MSETANPNSYTHNDQQKSDIPLFNNLQLIYKFCLSALYLIACYVRVTVGDSGLC